MPVYTATSSVLTSLIFFLSFSEGEDSWPIEQPFDPIPVKVHNFVGKNKTKFMLLAQNSIRMDYLLVSTPTSHHTLAQVMP